MRKSLRNNGKNIIDHDFRWYKHYCERGSAAQGAR